MSIISCRICKAPLTGLQKAYCSKPCKNRAKYERDLATGYEEIKRRRRAKTWAEHLELTAKPTCSADGCDRPHTARGLCLMHYKRTMPKKPGAGHRGRARRHGVEYETVNKTTVFNRDNWTCGICSQPVDNILKFPHPMSASIDHIIPMSRGGGHTYTNTQCSHLICNVKKSDLMETQNETTPTGVGVENL